MERWASHLYNVITYHHSDGHKALTITLAIEEKRKRRIRKKIAAKARFRVQKSEVANAGRMRRLRFHGTSKVFPAKRRARGASDTKVFLIACRKQETRD